MEEIHYSTAAVDEAAVELLSRAGIGQPPVNAVRLARTLGLEVAWDGRQRGRARLVSDGPSALSNGTILLKPEPRPERRQWAVAHEVGEHLAVELFQRAGIKPADIQARMREDAANLLAARLLLPRRWFEQDAIGCGWDLLALKAQYSTASHELIARRMLDFEPPIVISIFDQGQVTFRRANCCRIAPRICAEEYSAQQRANISGEPVTHGGELSVQAWPVHEPQWKREILRTVVPEQ